MVKVKCKSVELAATGKYRYVFNIKNFDQNKSKFNGIVTISLISQEEHSIRNDEFELKDFASGTNKDVTIEANTGLVEVHGQSGISKYGFSIKSNSEKQAFEGFNNIEEYKLNEDYRIKPEYK